MDHIFTMAFLLRIYCMLNYENDSKYEAKELLAQVLTIRMVL